MLGTLKVLLALTHKAAQCVPAMANHSGLVVVLFFVFVFCFCFFWGGGCQVNNTVSLVVELSVLRLESSTLPVHLIILLFQISKRSLHNVAATKTKLFDPIQHFIPHIDFLKCVLYVCVMKCICGKLKRLPSCVLEMESFWRNQIKISMFKINTYKYTCKLHLK